MQATKYLIEADGKLHGYNRLDLLKIDLATNKPSHWRLFKYEPVLALRYVELTQDEIKEELEGRSK
jgi:hypothetical protein